jgi:hypothetical protein
MNAAKQTLNMSGPVPIEMMAHNAAGERDDFQIIVLVN